LVHSELTEVNSCKARYAVTWWSSDSEAVHEGRIFSLTTYCTLMRPAYRQNRLYSILPRPFTSFFWWLMSISFRYTN
jgi:hypothetical protein